MCKNFLSIVFLTSLSLFFAQCRFSEIDQSETAQPGEIIEIFMTIIDEIVPEPNPHRGVVCVLVPQDWLFISAEYSFSLGAGTMELAPDWADSAETCYPAAEIAENMKWTALISDSGYSYEEPIEIDVVLKWQVGQTEGCFDLGYLVTKATQDLICSGNPSWAPLSYPHHISVSDSSERCPTLTVEGASEWEALFDRRSGWTGADGIYSIPLSGIDVPSDLSSEPTLFVFSDTFIGEVDENDHRQEAALVNNTLAFLEANRPDSEHIQFIWGTKDNQPTAVFVPETPNSNPGDWYWLMDGIALNDRIYVFGLRLNTGGGGFFNFEIVGVSLISFTLDSNLVVTNPEQVETPLFYKNENEGWEIVLGQAVMPMTEESGNPNPDGYIYVYGPRSRPSPKELVAARVLPQDFEDFSKWRYWDGERWSLEVENCAAITNQISQEFSVTPMEDGQFLLAFQLGSYVAIRMGETPTGPFGFFQKIWACPEVEEDRDIFVYNAKAHPHLSEPGELLISYNVNTFDFSDHFSNADIYRPRFITLKLHQDEFPAGITESTPHPESLALRQNYPNPFNAATTIQFSIPVEAEVRVVVSNVLGEQVAVLHDGPLNAGIYQYSWDARSVSGVEVASGIYFYLLEATTHKGLEWRRTRKMLVLR